MQVELYKGFIKRKNSTKQPTELTSVVKDVKLKGECSVLNPSFFLADADSYTYLKAWGNYYFIDRVAYDINGAQYINCSIDVLASYKAAILGTTAFVAYSSSNYSALLHDSRIAMLTDVDVIVDDTVESIFTTTPHYLLSVVGEDGVNVLAPTDPNIIPATLYQKQATDLITALCIQWSDAQSCLLELKEVPIAIGADYVLEPAHVGKIDIGDRYALNQYFNSAREEQFESIAIPVTYNDFRLFSFVEARLYLPFVGVIELPLESFYPDPTSTGLVKIHTIANPLTGSVAYTLKNGYDEIVGVYTGTFGRTLPLNTSKPNDMISAITHFVSSASSMIEKKPDDVLSSMIQSVSSAVKFKGSVIGSFSGSYGEYLGTNFVLSVEKHKSNNEPSNLTDIAGRPCAKVLPLTNLTGYVETRNFSIAVEAIAEVRDLINSAMDRGVYIE